LGSGFCDAGQLSKSRTLSVHTAGIVHSAPASAAIRLISAAKSERAASHAWGKQLMRPRGSIVGPLILITIGVLFLARTVVPAFSAFDFFVAYWPYLLIAWGLLQIAEISLRMSRGASIPANGVSAGGWFLVLLICLLGFGLFELHGPESWWRRASFDQGMDWFGEAHEFAVPDQTKTVGKSPHIVIESFRGNAKITGTDISELRLSGHKTVRAMKDGDANRADEATPVQIIQDGGQITVRVNQNGVPRNSRVSTDLELVVPKGSSLEASGQSGDFDVNGLDGDISIASDNAGIRLQDINGNVMVDTRRGDLVRCINVRGNVELKGRSSDLELEKVKGQVTIAGTYSGTITLRELSRPVHVENFHTAVTVQKVNGQITMDRGSFLAENIVGPSQLTTQATDVDVTGFTDALDVTVDKGDVNLRAAKGGLSRVAVRTRSGNIDLALPENANFDLSASTEHGDVENEFGAPLKVESAGRGARLIGAIGAGPNVTLSTDRGTVTVRKSGAGDERVVSREQREHDDRSPSDTDKSDDVPPAPKALQHPKAPAPPAAPSQKLSTVEL
jgi:DUF4097 and DUF4098 domain-containing protein YvlB